MKVIVVGCGVVGSFVGWFLKKAGVNVICVSLRKKFPHVSLIQSVMQKFREDIEMAYRSRLIYENITRELCLHNCIKRVKSYTIISSERLDIVKNLIDVWRSYDITIRFLTSQDIKELPFRVYDGEVVFEGYPDYLVRIDRIIHSLWKELGVIESKAKVSMHNGKIKVILEYGEIIEGDIAVISCGAYTRSLLKDLNINIPLIPYKCQAGLFIVSSDRSDYILYDYVNRIYVRPADHPVVSLVNKITLKTKLMICGNGNSPPIEPDEAERKVDYYFRKDMSAKLKKRFTGAQYLLGKADFCDTTPDSKPLVAKIGNLIIVSGFNGYGVEIGPAIAKLVAKLITGKKLDDYEQRYLVSRFTGFVRTDRLPETEAHEL